MNALVRYGLHLKKNDVAEEYISGFLKEKRKG